MLFRRLPEQEVIHGLARLSFEQVSTAQHEGAIGNEAVEGITHEGEFEIAVEGILPQKRTQLPQGKVAVLDRGQFRPGEALVHEQADLFDILITHLFAQGLPHGVSAGFGHGREDEAVTMGNYHGASHGKKRPLAKERGRMMWNRWGRLRTCS